MKVFLSWSGPVSRDVASAFRDWIPYVIQSVKPFVSAGDIEKGRRWSDVLGDELNQSSFGIICITRDNVNAPWLNFEAGAISKAIDNLHVSPFLFNVDPSRIHGPLQQFQFTVFEKEDVFQLMRSINGLMKPDEQVAQNILRDEFDHWWPRLEERLSLIARNEPIGPQTGFDWLYTIEDLAATHGVSDSRHVWWITPDPYNYALVPPAKALIQERLKQGAFYSFFIPDSDDRSEAKEGLAQLGKGTSGRVQVIPVQSERFRLLAVTDYLIVDPDSSSVRVLLELPIATRGYWIVVKDEAAQSFVHRFREFEGKLASSASA